MKLFTFSLLALAGLALAPSAQVTVRVTGQVSSNGWTKAPWDTTAVGTPVVFSTTFAGVGASFFPGLWDLYDSAAFGAQRLTVGTRVVGGQGGGATVINDFVSPTTGNFVDSISMLDYAVDGFELVGEISIELEDSTQTLLSAAGLSGSQGIFAGSLFSNTSFQIVDLDSSGDGTGTTMVVDVAAVEIFATPTSTASQRFQRNDAQNSNFQLFASSHACLGGVLSLNVRNFPGFPACGVLARRGQDDVPTQFGGLLVDLTTQDLLNLPLQPGLEGNWSVPVPEDVALSGVTFSTQGFGVGGPAGITAYNAFDYTIGY